MASPDSFAPVQFIIDTLRKRVEESSLRKVAGEVGLSPNGLRGILAGASTRPSNVKKLVAWFRRSEDQAPRPTPDVVEAALAVLSSELPADQRGEAEADLLSRLEHRFDLAGVTRPAWIITLREGKR